MEGRDKAVFVVLPDPKANDVPLGDVTPAGAFFASNEPIRRRFKKSAHPAAANLSDRDLVAESESELQHRCPETLVP